VPPPISIQALVDTGASGTCVDSKILTALGLTPTGKAQVTTMTTGKSVHHADEYDASVVISAATGQSPLRVHGIPIMSVDFTAQPIGAVIGRDVLGLCVLIYDGARGTFTVAY